MLGNAFKLPTDISSVDFAAKQSPKAIPLLSTLPPSSAYLLRSAVTGFLKCPQWFSLICFELFYAAFCGHKGKQIHGKRRWGVL